MRTKQSINICLSPELVEALDENRGPSQRLSRSSVVEKAVRLFLAIENESTSQQKSA